jgi:hypothetical protein
MEESKALNSYLEAIQKTMKLGYKLGKAEGLGVGVLMGFPACHGH